MDDKHKQAVLVVALAWILLDGVCALSFGDLLVQADNPTSSQHQAAYMQSSPAPGDATDATGLLAAGLGPSIDFTKLSP